MSTSVRSSAGPLLALALVLLVGTIGCRRDVGAPEPSRETISTERFAEVLSDLVLLRIEALPDTQAYRLRRDTLLERHGVTREDLVEFAEVHGRDDETMAAVYRRLGARLDTISEIRRDSITESFFPSGEEAGVGGEPDTAGGG
ncbi:MAG: hypothetical protein R3199_00650 [Gemmatimonadota bacterium]|nr:hypothetical protein [Gemmatimonadota bacterium]